MYARAIFALAVILTGTGGRNAVFAEVNIRVVDVGAGLCCVVTTDDGHYMIYDAGNFQDNGTTAMTAIEELIPYGSTIDLMVVSHGDADHLAAIPFVCEYYTVKEVWRDGLPRSTDIWQRANTAIQNEVRTDGCRDYNLQNWNLDPGYSVDIGNARATFLCGFSEIPGSWLPLSDPEDLNARSVVVRLDHGHSSVLFGGDTVGRHIGDPQESCIAAEKFLVDNAANVPIDVDVVVAPHHGADNANSTAFVQAMSPRYVIFSSNSKHHHPHRGAAMRYLANGVDEANIFRTDRGDNEGSPEWKSRSGADADPMGDDDVSIVLKMNGSIEVDYITRTRRWRSPFALREPTVALGKATDSELPTLSPQILKYAADESLWMETHDDLESHTQEGSRVVINSEKNAPAIQSTCCVEQRSQWCQKKKKSRFSCRRIFPRCYQ